MLLATLGYLSLYAIAVIVFLGIAIAACEVHEVTLTWKGVVWIEVITAAMFLLLVFRTDLLPAR